MPLPRLICSELIELIAKVEGSKNRMLTDRLGKS